MTTRYYPEVVQSTCKKFHSKGKVTAKSGPLRPDIREKPSPHSCRCQHPRAPYNVIEHLSNLVLLPELESKWAAKTSTHNLTSFSSISPLTSGICKTRKRVFGVFAPNQDAQVDEVTVHAPSDEDLMED